MGRSKRTHVTFERRDFPRLKANFKVRFGVCGAHGQEVPGFTGDLSLSGFSFVTPETGARAGDYISVEITVPSYEEPLYFLGQVIRTHLVNSGTEIACRFDWLGKSDRYKEKLAALISAHDVVASRVSRELGS